MPAELSKGADGHKYASPWANYRCCDKCHRPAKWWAGHVEQRRTGYFCDKHLPPLSGGWKHDPI